MAFADASVYDDTGDGSIIGSFREKDHGHLFEVSDNDDLDAVNCYQFPHKVWVTTASRHDRGYRYAHVKKTVAYIVVDEDDFGDPIVKKWNIKELCIYNNKSL